MPLDQRADQVGEEHDLDPLDPEQYGTWHASTTGRFMPLLLDVGADPVIAWRILEDGEPDDEGEYTRRMEIVLVPNGQVRETFAALDVQGVDRVLGEFLRHGIVT